MFPMRPPRAPMPPQSFNFFAQQYSQPKHDTILSMYQTQNGPFDFDKTMYTVKQVQKIYGELGPIIDLFKKK